MDTLRFLDVLGFLVGLVYLYLEYKASIWLWLASIIMPAVDMVLYFKAGLYADFGMAIYYCLAAVYGWAVWTFGKKKGQAAGAALPITHFKQRLIVPTTIVMAGLWFLIWWFLSRHTNSTVPVTDAFTTALSIVALWALARKYAEQWLLWLVVDAVCLVLYIQKGIPFKAAIYGVYTVFAIVGYRKWLTQIASPAAAS
ncbi:MAG: nicotinamide riboside transporter PnuC [Prevotella sp.]|nr:nicotinamide riboside transporter PnuC [Prevotella sp.]